MKILIVKLGALGDVLRTTPLLTALKKKHPQSHVTWVVEDGNAGVLEGAPIDRLVKYSAAVPASLKKEKFDLVVNLDKEPEALDCFMAAPAPRKLGFGRGADGKLCAADPLSDYAYRLGIDDELKFRTNKKTYQQISFEQVGLEFDGEEYLFAPDEASKKHVESYFASKGTPVESWKRPVIGLNTGAGHRFAGKKLPVSTYVEIARKLYDRHGATILLLGGQAEIERNRQIEQMVSRPVVNAGSHSIRQFAAIVSLCDLVLSGDTTAMHIAIAVKTPVIVHFASTCHAEIELYGRGAKLVSEIHCGPCYKRICPIDEQCMKDVRADDIVAAAEPYLLKSGKKR